VEEVGRESPECELWPTFYGEALILGRNRELWSRLDYAASVGCRNLLLNSNGTLLDRWNNLEEILASPLRRFILSLDGLSAGTFESIRLGARRERVYAAHHHRHRGSFRRSPAGRRHGGRRCVPDQAIQNLHLTAVRPIRAGILAELTVTEICRSGDLAPNDTSGSFDLGGCHARKLADDGNGQGSAPWGWSYPTGLGESCRLHSR
jgi:hypothetical protein